MTKPIQGYEFTVEGTHEFPFDMLRYDRCWPKAEMEIINLAPHPRSGMFKEKRKVTLRSLNEPTDGRWRSFGWQVIDYQRVGIVVS